MKPAEVAIALRQFEREIESLKGNDLLDKWIAFKGGPDSKVPDLGVLKSLSLEAALNKEFGIGNWHDAVEARRRAS